MEEGRHVQSTTRFAQPRRFITAQLYTYTYIRKEIRRIYRRRGEFELRQWLARTFPDQPNLMPTVEGAVNAVYWGALWLLLCGPICFYLLCCRCCISGRSKPPSKEIDYKSTSADDVMAAKKTD